MKAIWKFPLAHATPLSSHGVEMPAGARVVRFALVANVPTVWALVDDQAPREVRSFTAYGTGHEIPDHAWYVGTWDAGPFVWHLFDVTCRAEATKPDPVDQAGKLLLEHGAAAEYVEGKPAKFYVSADGLTTEEMEAIGTLRDAGIEVAEA